MNKFQLAILPVLLLGATVAAAQDKGKLSITPAVRAGDLHHQPPKRTDLVIEEVAWVYAPPRNMAGIPGPLALLARAVEDAVGGPRHQPRATDKVLQSPHVKVTVRNAGTERWASTGRVVARVWLGTPEERDGRGASTGHGGVSVVPGAPASSALVVDVVRGGKVSQQPFSAGAPIPGSLAPGERRTIDVKLEGKGGNADARKRLLMVLDKYYTASVDIQATGDDQPSNNGADLVFRLDGGGQMVEPVLTQRDTDPARRGTVEVRGPGK
jgi:hypothetical protein